MNKTSDFLKLKSIAEGKDCLEKDMLAKALLIEKIKRKKLNADDCIAILDIMEKITRDR